MKTKPQRPVDRSRDLAYCSRKRTGREDGETQVRSRSRARHCNITQTNNVLGFSSIILSVCKWSFTAGREEMQNKMEKREKHKLLINSQRSVDKRSFSSKLLLLLSALVRA